MPNGNKGGVALQSENVEATLDPAGEPPSDEHFKTTPHMVLFSIFAACSAWLANFDSGFGGMVLIMDPYKRSFGKCTPDGECSISTIQQSIVQLTNLFIAVGSALSGTLSHYVGHRGSLQCGCLLIAIGAAGMLGTSANFTAYMACKCIGGVGIGFLYASVPTWGTESVAPPKRGFLMSLYNVGLSLGNVGAAGVCLGSSQLRDDWSWKTPIACQIPIALAFAALSAFFSQSPRWLIVKGREDEARHSFARFRAEDPASPFVTAYIQDVKAHLEHERELASSTSWAEIFGRRSLARTHIAVVVLLGLALTGIQFVIPYSALFLEGVGVEDPFLINLIVALCIFLGCVPGPFVVEYLGRRGAMIGGYSLMAACMLIIGTVGSGLGQANPIAQKVLVAFLAFWAFVFGATIGPVAWVSSSEMHSQQHRSQGQAYAVGVYEVFAFGAAFWTPYMLSADYGNMGTSVAYFYFGITVFFLVASALFVPETAQLSLEQIDDYFASNKKAWKTSVRNNKSIALEEAWRLAAAKDGE